MLWDAIKERDSAELIVFGSFIPPLTDHKRRVEIEGLEVLCWPGHSAGKHKRLEFNMSSHREPVESQSELSDVS